MSPSQLAGAPASVCFVCTGNICRSPMAEMVLAQRAEEAGLDIVVSSAGTGPWHEGEPMDPRARRALEAAGYQDRGHLAHQFTLDQFDRLDLIVALDRRHRQTLVGLAGERPVQDRLSLLRSFDPGAGGAVDVPDPYYGDQSDFARCLTMVEAGCRGLLEALRSAHHRAGDPEPATERAD